MKKKLKLFLISDDLRAPSGVGTQSNFLAQKLVAMGDWEIVQLAGIINPTDTTPVQLTPDIKLYPCNGYGDMYKIRELLEKEKPDVMMIFTDPRFFYWLWDMENEIRTRVPLAYWHVWDDTPPPDYNKTFYESTDAVVGLSYLTYGVVQKVLKRTGCDKYDEVDRDYLDRELAL